MLSEELYCTESHVDNDPVIVYSMRVIEVDGIPSSLRNGGTVYGQSMITLKSDGLSEYERLSNYYAQPDKDGYLDDTDFHVAWEGSYSPVPYKDGEMDEELWLNKGVLVGKDDPDRYIYY